MRPTVICLTPVKNEAWILERFLRAASLWADHIIIADQNSDDGSVEIARGFDKVRLIRNTTPGFNEPERQRMLIDAAREMPFPRLLIALDADEFLTPNLFGSPEWDAMLGLQPGSGVSFELVDIRPDMRSYWAEGGGFLFGFMDDGTSEHRGSVIHSTRVPVPDGAEVIRMDEIKVIHFQFSDWARMESKHRWYQCWERVNNPDKSALDIYRMYHHMYSVNRERLLDVPGWWFDGYSGQGVDIKKLVVMDSYWWDKEVLYYLETHRPGAFSREAIWDVDWEAKAAKLGISRPERFADRRSLTERFVHLWLRHTQMYSKRRLVRLIDRVLKRVLGW